MKAADPHTAEQDRLISEINEVTRDIYSGPAYHRARLRTGTDEELRSAHLAHTERYGIPVIKIDA